jgi:hypothetical protein
MRMAFSDERYPAMRMVCDDVMMKMAFTDERGIL